MRTFEANDEIILWVARDAVPARITMQAARDHATVAIT